MNFPSPAEISQRRLSMMYYAVETTAPEAHQLFRFTDLPGEIRNNIYKLVLSSQRVPRGRTTPLLLVSKAVHQECKDFWFERRLVILPIDFHGTILNLADGKLSEFNDNKLVGPQLASTLIEVMGRQKNFMIVIIMHKSNKVAVESIISRITAATLAIAMALKHRKDIDTIKVLAINLYLSAKATSCTEYASRIFDPLEKHVRNVKSVEISCYESSHDPRRSIIASYIERVGKVMEVE